MTSSRQRARDIVAEILSTDDYGTMDTGSLIALSELMVCVYMNSCLDGGTLWRDDAFGQRVRSIAATLEQRPYSEDVAAALFNLSRTDFYAATSTPEHYLAQLSVPAPAGELRCAADLRAHYNAALCTPGYRPTDQTAARYLTAADTLLSTPGLPLSDRYRLLYVTYSSLAECEELGV